MAASAPGSAPRQVKRVVARISHVAGGSIPMTAVANIAANIRKAMTGERLSQQVDIGRGY
jgi:hypothetical protein